MALIQTSNDGSMPTESSMKTILAQQEASHESEPTTPRPPQVIEDPADKFGHESWEFLNLAPMAEDPEYTDIMELRRLADGAGDLLEQVIADNLAFEGRRQKSIFDLRKVTASISVADYLFNILQKTWSSPETVVIAIAYILRLREDLCLDQRNVHKMVLAALLVADKYSNDYAGSWTSKHFAASGGLPLKELHKLEAKLLTRLGFDAGISEEEYSHYRALVMDWMPILEEEPEVEVQPETNESQAHSESASEQLTNSEEAEFSDVVEEVASSGRDHLSEPEYFEAEEAASYDWDSTEAVDLHSYEAEEAESSEWVQAYA